MIIALVSCSVAYGLITGTMTFIDRPESAAAAHPLQVYAYSTGNPRVTDSSAGTVTITLAAATA